MIRAELSGWHVTSESISAFRSTWQIEIQLSFFIWCLVCLFEIGFRYVAQFSVKIEILWSLPLECWHSRHASLYLVKIILTIMYHSILKVVFWNPCSCCTSINLYCHLYIQEILWTSSNCSYDCANNFHPLVTADPNVYPLSCLRHLFYSIKSKKVFKSRY